MCFPVEPTAVTENLGMNDFGWSGFDQKHCDAFTACETEIGTELAAKNIRVAFITPKPVEKDAKPADNPCNQSLSKFSEVLAGVAQATGGRYVNIFQPLLDLITAAHAKQPDVSVFEGDWVHPGAPGKLIMGWACLKGLGASAEVSSATIDAEAQKCTQNAHCVIDQISSQNAGIQFQRLDECLPLPIPQEAVAGLQAAPILDDLSRYELTVTGLKAAHYNLKIDGVVAAPFTREQLAAGVNLTNLPGPITTQTQDLYKKILTKEGYFRFRWTNVQIYQPTFPDWVKDP